jgi:hypothetical protein
MDFDSAPASPTADGERTRVLFVTYGSAHIAKVAPVVAELERRGVECVVLALTVGYRQAQRLGLHPLGYGDLMHLLDDPQRALAFGRTLLEGNSHPDVDAHESACYLGVNYLEWVEEAGEAEARERYLAGGRRAFKPVRFMQKVIAHLRPDVVVSTSSPRSEQAAIEAAVAAGIPSLTMMDSFALPAEPYHRHRIRADRVTVLSEGVKSNLVAMGMDAQRIRVTGCPGFDGHFSADLAQSAAAFRHRQGWVGLQVILWAGGIEETPGTPGEFAGPLLAQAVEQQLRAHVSEHEDWALIVRYHPSQYHLFAPVARHPRVYISNPSEEPIEQMADTLIELVQARSGRR